MLGVGDGAVVAVASGVPSNVTGLRVFSEMKRTVGTPAVLRAVVALCDLNAVLKKHARNSKVTRENTREDPPISLRDAPSGRPPKSAV